MNSCGGRKLTLSKRKSRALAEYNNALDVAIIFILVHFTFRSQSESLHVLKSQRRHLLPVQHHRVKAQLQVVLSLFHQLVILETYPKQQQQLSPLHYHQAQ